MQAQTEAWWIWAVLSAVFAALTTVFAKIGVAGVSSNLATAIRTVVILLFAWGIVAWTGQASGIAALSRKTWLFLLLSGLSTGASWLFYFRALQIGNTTLVASIDKASLGLILIFGVLVLGEPLTLKSAIATALVLAGTLVAVLP